MDITYIPIKREFLYLVSILDWYSRKVLYWRLSNTLDASFCISAIEEAINKYGSPEISNSDQGSQFTTMDFTNLLKKYNIRIFMDQPCLYKKVIFYFKPSYCPHFVGIKLDL